MRKIFDFFARLKSVWKFSGVALKVANYAATYPGHSDSANLRSWIRPALLDLSVLATITETTIDDKVAWAALRIVDSDKSWGAVYSLVIIATESGGHLIPGSDTMRDTAFEAMTVTEIILEESKTENPAIIIAAIGLLVQILQLMKNR